MGNGALEICHEECHRLELKNAKLQAENKRLKKAIESYGNNPSGFDWAVLERIDVLENALEKIVNTPVGRSRTKIAEQALKGK